MCISYFVNPFVSQNPTPEREQVIANFKKQVVGKVEPSIAQIHQWRSRAIGLFIIILLCVKLERVC
jgi:hypothetical protein